MAAAIRNNIGSLFTKTGANTIATNAYSNIADVLTISTINDGSSNIALGALLCDFGLNLTYATAPVAGAIVLVAADWSLEASPLQPAAPATTMITRYVGTFDKQPQASNAVLTWKARLNAIPLTQKTDFYLLNAATGQTISASWVLTAQAWSPG
jgi:hypothetical protein